MFRYPLELILFLVLVYGLFKFFCWLANSVSFSRALKKAKGSPESDEEVIEQLDNAEKSAVGRADELERGAQIMQHRGSILRKRVD